MKKLITILFITMILTGCTNSSVEAISLDEAQEIALKTIDGKVTKANNGYLIKCELDIDDGIQKYEVEIKNGNIEYEIDIDAITGEIIKYEEDHD